jgi:mannose-6-phosphate isomerase-like protein (cupin superfamily)
MAGNIETAKVNARNAPEGAMGQKYLACGERMGMRLWVEHSPLPAKPATQREYETLGFVIAGRAELNLEGKSMVLEAGDSWVVPAGALHSYTIPASFTALEVTSPPGQREGRDEHQGTGGASH